MDEPPPQAKVVSIPERVWGGLEPADFVGVRVDAVGFQSLRGFGVGWSAGKS